MGDKQRGLYYKYLEFREQMGNPPEAASTNIVIILCYQPSRSITCKGLEKKN